MDFQDADAQAGSGAGRAGSSRDISVHFSIHFVNSPTNRVNAPMHHMAEPGDFPPAGSFETFFASATHDAGHPPRPLAAGECQSSSTQHCPLCAAGFLRYEDELVIKDRALHTYWKSLHLPVPLESLVASPLGRGYRTVTKRKLLPFRGAPRLGLIAPAESGQQRPFDVIHCAIEPDTHAALYARAAQEIRRPEAAPLVAALRYMIVKGNERENIVILSVATIAAPVEKAATALSKALSRTGVPVSGVFLYEDQSDGRFYLGSTHPDARTREKKIYGRSILCHDVLGTRLFHPPFSFSQVNHSILDLLVRKASDLLQLHGEIRLYDLYCGYGLFSLCMAGKVKAAVGIELAHGAVGAAIANARRLKITNVRFFRSSITADALPKFLGRMGRDDAVLLDPPRGGTAPGVIEWIASRRPGRVLHLFCNVDQLPGEIRKWTASGYTPTSAVPFDMFPGIPSAEILVLLSPQRERGAVHA